MGGVCVAAEIVREGGPEALEREKQALVDEINALGMKELRLKEIHFIGGFIGNLDYPLMGKSIQFLRENDIYFGTQVERSDGLCYGIVADREYLIVSEYGAEGANPRLLLVKFRGA